MIKERDHLHRHSAAVLLLLVGLILTGCASGPVAQSRPAEKEQKRMLEAHRKEAARQAAEHEDRMKAEKDPGAFERSGDLYLRQGNLDLAFVEYNRALQGNPRSTDVRQKMAGLMLKKGMWADAAAEFDAVLKKDGDNVRALQGKAQAMLGLSRTQEAEKCLTRALGIDSALWDTYALFGALYDRQERYADAADAYRKALAINPGATAVYTDLGVCLYRMGDYRGSADAFLRAAKSDPSDPRVYNSLGLTFFRMGMYMEALEVFRKGGDDGGAYNNMGILYMKDGQYENAVEAFKKAIDAKPVYYGSAQVGLERARAELARHRAVR